MKKVGPVTGLTIHQFYHDNQLWKGKSTLDEQFEQNGRVTCYQPFDDEAEVYVVGGEVIEDKSGKRIPMPEVFLQWLATQKTTFVVPVEEARRDELAALLENHGFAFKLSGKHLLEPSGENT